MESMRLEDYCKEVEFILFILFRTKRAIRKIFTLVKKTRGGSSTENHFIYIQSSPLVAPLQSSMGTPAYTASLHINSINADRARISSEPIIAFSSLP